MEMAHDLAVDDVLISLLDTDEVDGLAELEIDPVQMPVAKSSVVYTVTIHC
ncbi:hypothetical protein [Microbispora hainanensis]|uniref:Uncharacterized protein n=1 Tax=Microbispora hainanensis TaxID=568844 RepID=A0ABZ1SJ18_9ACTN|nr:hypothetical protein [Microbispora hainanensis]